MQHTAHCTLHTAHCTLQAAHFTHQTVRCTLNTSNSILHTARAQGSHPVREIVSGQPPLSWDKSCPPGLSWASTFVNCTLYTLMYTVHSNVHCTLYCPLYPLHCTLYTVLFNVLYNVLCLLYIHCEQCPLFTVESSAVLDKWGNQPWQQDPSHDATITGKKCAVSSVQWAVSSV